MTIAELEWQHLKTPEIIGGIFTKRTFYVLNILTILTNFGNFKFLTTTFIWAA